MSIDWDLHWDDEEGTVRKHPISACFSQFFDTARCYADMWGDGYRPTKLVFRPRPCNMNNSEVKQYCDLLSSIPAFAKWHDVKVDGTLVTVTVDCNAPIRTFGSILYIYRHIQEQRETVMRVLRTANKTDDKVAALLFGLNTDTQQQPGGHTLAAPDTYDRAWRIYYWLLKDDDKYLKGKVGEPMNTGATIRGSGWFWCGSEWHGDGQFYQDTRPGRRRITCVVKKLHERVEKNVPKEVPSETINRGTRVPVRKAVQSAHYGPPVNKRSGKGRAVQARCDALHGWRRCNTRNVW